GGLRPSGRRHGRRRLGAGGRRLRDRRALRHAGAPEPRRDRGRHAVPAGVPGRRHVAHPQRRHHGPDGRPLRRRRGRAVRAALRQARPLRGHVPALGRQDLRDRGDAMRPRLALVAALAAAVAVAACGGGTGGDGVDYEAVDLVTGEEVSVADLAGRPALLVSWATWCTECDEVLAGLQGFAESPAADGVEVVAVNLDASDAGGAIEAKVDEHGLTTTLWRDRRNEFKRAFGALGVPTTVVLDRDGAVAATFPGAVDLTGEEVAAALAEARGDGAP